MKILDKEEFRIKLEEINNLVEKKDYKGAMEVVDSIDWRRVKNVRTLCVVGEIYAANKRYNDSREIFLLAYHKAPIGKNILYRLIEISLKMGDIEEAMEYFEEFKEIAPNDNTRYVLKYKILRAKKASLNEQIAVLEEYKEKEFTEKWTYELAKLYYKAGNKEKCLEICDELILWFNEGTYVMKALDLKMRMGLLTGAEKEKYEKQFIPKLLKPEEAKALKENMEKQEEKPAPEPEKPEIESIQIRNDKDLEGAETLQEKISKGIRDIFRAKRTSYDEFDEEEEENPEEEQKEMLKTPSSEEEYDKVPELEEEFEKTKKTEKKTEPEETISEKQEEASAKEPSFDFSQTIKMPELNIPRSMRNMMPKEAPEVEAKPFEDKADFDFNLEDTILAAASAQGIDIPEEKETPEIRKNHREEEEKSEQVADLTMDDLEEEIFSEEDLRQAEQEFMKGPSAAQKEEVEIKLPFDMSPSKKEEKTEIPDLESEDIIDSRFTADEEETEDEDILGDVFGDDIQEEEEIFHDFSEEEEEIPEEILPESMRSREDEPALDEELLSEEEELERFIDSMNMEEETDALKIVPREKELRDEEKKLFTYFIKIPGMKEQLLEALLDAQLAAADKTSKTGNIVVMGGRETGKTRLISSLIPAVCKELNLEAANVAYIFAEQINGKDLRKIMKKLSGGFFVIEDANQLDQETAEQLNQIMEEETEGLTVILEDEKIGMRKMLARYPKLAKKFTSVINIPVFTNDELANFAKVYAKENGYKIDNMGMLALYNLIGINQKEDEPMNIGAVKNLIDAAISKSQGGRLFKKNTSKKRMDRDGYIVLYEKDFSGK
ncbi:Tetratricopeptide repeat protein [uncultured Blautia sp.]